MTKGHEKTSGGDGYISYLDFCGTYTTLCVCGNTTVHKKSEFTIHKLYINKPDFKK